MFISVQDGLIGIIFDETIDYKELYLYCKKLLLNKETRKQIITLIIKEINNIKKKNNVMKIIEINKTFNTSMFDEFIKDMKVLMNVSHLFNLLWKNGINDSRLMGVDYTYSSNFDDWEPKQNIEDNAKQPENYNFLTECFFIINNVYYVYNNCIDEMNKDINLVIKNLDEYISKSDNSIVKLNFENRKKKYEEWKNI